MYVISAHMLPTHINCMNYYNEAATLFYPLRFGTWVLTRDTTVSLLWLWKLVPTAELQELLRTAIIPRTISMTFPTRDHTHQSILANIQGRYTCMQHLVALSDVRYSTITYQSGWDFSVFTLIIQCHVSYRPTPGPMDDDAMECPSITIQYLPAGARKSWVNEVIVSEKKDALTVARTKSTSWNNWFIILCCFSPIKLMLCVTIVWSSLWVFYMCSPVTHFIVGAVIHC